MARNDGSNLDQSIGIAVLAAGASTRMGTPKQLLKIKGVSLIRRAAEHALDSGCRPVVVVLGANAELIAPELNGLGIKISVNADWKMGISSSIRCGLKMLLGVHPQTQSVILFLADQPHVNGRSLRKLIAAHVESGCGLVTASYSSRMGTPALFSRVYFNELLEMEGQGGAKSLLERHASLVFEVGLPEAACDLDTPQDLADFTSVQEAIK
ncbi:MAG: putative MobA-like protein [Verrucomicrobiales bacterium]|nr:putative MobA-like protein [Verrucomicrobiales bacterium]